jgi:sirohydrochlorin ferrochelatase
MSSETVLLVGRESHDAERVLWSHADRLARRGVAADVTVATYETEPVRELRDQFESLSGETVYAVPMCVAHSHETTEGVPAALSYVPGEVRYCEPPGRSPAVTEALEREGTSLVAAEEDASLVLVGFGSASKPYHRQTADYHAARLRDGSDYGEVVTCYLLQNPAVECVRYTLSGERAVAVPLFLHRSEATERRIPEALEPDRGGLAYADPLGDSPRVTDAVAAAVEKRRTLAAETDAFEDRLTQSRRPLATDGEGPPR